MPPKLPSLSKSQSVTQLLPPLGEHTAAGVKKVRDRRPDSIPFRKVWGGKFDPIWSTRAPSESSSRVSEASTRIGSRASSATSSRASSRLSSPSSSSARRTASQRRLGHAVSVPSLPLHQSRASSPLSSPSSSVQREPAPQCRLSSAASVPLLQLHKLAKNDTLPSPSLANAAVQLSSLGCASEKQSPTKKDIDETQRQLEKACRNTDIVQAKICYLRGASLSQHYHLES